MIDKSQVVEALRTVVDPEIGINIIDLNMLRSVKVQGKSVSVTIALTVPSCPLADKIKADVENAIKSIEGVENAEVQFTFMTKNERKQIFSRLNLNKTIAETLELDELECIREVAEACPFNAIHIPNLETNEKLV